jgi:hypothetical protein
MSLAPLLSTFCNKLNNKWCQYSKNSIQYMYLKNQTWNLGVPSRTRTSLEGAKIWKVHFEVFLKLFYEIIKIWVGAVFAGRVRMGTITSKFYLGGLIAVVWLSPGTISIHSRMHGRTYSWTPENWTLSEPRIWPGILWKALEEHFLIGQLVFKIFIPFKENKHFPKASLNPLMKRWRVKND